jgi:phosphatidate cytidylyltransferase
LLRWRLLLGIVLIAVLAGTCWLDFYARTPGVWLAPVSLVVCALASGEILWLWGSAGVQPRGWLVQAGNLLIVASSWLPLLSGRWPAEQPSAVLAWPLGSFVLCVLLALLIEIFAYRQPGGVVLRLGATLFAFAYVGLLLSFLVQVRSLGGGPLGIAALVALVAVVKLGDIGAYTVGRLVGRHKLAPYLSPGKTIEGAIGGIVFACAGSWLALAWLLPRIVVQSPMAVPGWLAFGVVVGLAGMAGDLAESLIKRDVGRKDSSNWMPGFGGVLDVIDSLLFAAPVAWICWITGLLPG